MTLEKPSRVGQLVKHDCCVAILFERKILSERLTLCNRRGREMFPRVRFAHEETAVRRRPNPSKPAFVFFFCLNYPKGLTLRSILCAVALRD